MVEPRFDVTGLGEMLLRLSVPSGVRLETATNLDLYPAGAEANVLTVLARLERRTSWFGALPKNPLGRLASSALRGAGVDTDGILWHERGRMGTYYVEFAPPPRGIQVTYDRAHSCISQWEASEVNWESLLDTRLLHLTGITPALSSSCHEIVTQALKLAKQRGVPVSFDVNYRQKLWTEAEAEKSLTAMIQGIEILFCSLNDAARIFHCKGSAQEIAAQMLERSQAKYLVMSVGAQGAYVWDGLNWMHEPSRTTQIVDRLGAGDALAAGVLHGWLEGDVTQGLKYGVTLSALALTQFGDMVVTNKAELSELCQGDSSLTR